MRRMGMQCGMRRIPSRAILGSWLLSALDAPHPGWVPMRRMGTRLLDSAENTSYNLRMNSGNYMRKDTCMVVCVTWDWA